MYVFIVSFIIILCVCVCMYVCVYIYNISKISDDYSEEHQYIHIKNAAIYAYLQITTFLKLYWSWGILRFSKTTT